MYIFNFLKFSFYIRISKQFINIKKLKNFSTTVQSHSQRHPEYIITKKNELF